MSFAERGEGCGGIPNVFHANWVSGLIVLLSVTTIWELLKRDRHTPMEPDPMISRQTEEKCIGPKPRGGRPPQGEWTLDTKKKGFTAASRCSFQQRILFVSMEHVQWLLDSHVLFFCFSFAIRGATLSTILSILLVDITSSSVITDCM